MKKSSHMDVAFWSYERPSRGYFGYHLRARTRTVREKLCQKLKSMPSGETHLLRFGADLDDVVNAGWSRTTHTYLTLSRGNDPMGGEGVALAIPKDSWSLLMELLEQVQVQAEGSVNVVGADGHVPLWIWWDAE